MIEEADRNGKGYVTAEDLQTDLQRENFSWNLQKLIRGENKSVGFPYLLKLALSLQDFYVMMSGEAMRVRPVPCRATFSWITTWKSCIFVMFWHKHELKH